LSNKKWEAKSKRSKKTELRFYFSYFFLFNLEKQKAAKGMGKCLQLVERMAARQNRANQGFRGALSRGSKIVKNNIGKEGYTSYCRHSMNIRHRVRIYQYQYEKRKPLALPLYPDNYTHTYIHIYIHILIIQSP
jgi:hypothetical protein